MRPSFFKGFGFSALAGLVMLASAQARASAVNSFSATACVNSELNGSTSHVLQSGQIVNRSAAPLADYCPVVNNSATASTHSASSVDVCGWSTARASLSVAACRTSIGGGGGVCTIANTSTVTGGIDHISVAPGPAWASGSPPDGYYVLVTFAPNAAIFSYAFVS